MSDTPDEEVADAPRPRRKGIPPWALLVVAIVAIGIGFLIGALIADIAGKKAAADQPTYVPVVQINDTNKYDAAAWGQNFPKEYDGWAKTTEFSPSLHLAATDLVRPGPAVDIQPREWVTPSKIEEDPRLVTMWSGNAFAKDYRHLRGHAYMTIDQLLTQRMQSPAKPQPGTCLNCHGTMPAVYAELGNGDLNAGYTAMNNLPYLKDDTHAKGAGDYAQGPISCIDCHDPATMELQITRPSLIEGMKALKASQGVQNYDVNRDATRQELRTLVCAQCHVEYYFSPTDKSLVFPWAKGTHIDQVWEYYQEVGFTDFAHAKTGAGIVKAQHPEFEAWTEGVHAANGVTCADCHMAYQRDGSQKVSNHDIGSPMSDVNGTCGTCHAGSEAALKSRVDQIQARFIASRDAALDSLTQLIAALEKARAEGSGVPAASIEAAQKLQNKASFYVDYGYSENSYGFHAPDYFQRIFSESLDASRKAQLILLGASEADLAASAQTTAHQEKADAAGVR